MLRLTPFTYVTPASVAEAVQLRKQYGDEAAYMGGGTDLLPNIKHRLAEPKFVIGLRSLREMQSIVREESGGLRLGGSVRLSQLEHSPLVRNEYPALADAAAVISSPQVRRVGTLGGNICLDVRCNYYNQSEHWRRAVGFCMKKDSEICRVAPGSDRCWAVSSADTVPVLLAHGAQVAVFGPAGERLLPLEELYRDDGLVPMALQPDEVVAAVRLPPPNGLRVVYSKLRIRMSFDFPLVGAATGLALDVDGMVRQSRIFLTAVASLPMRVRAAEELLIGRPLTDELIRAAGDQVFRSTHPMDNTEGSIPHRKRMARVYVERALRDFARANPDA